MTTQKTTYSVGDKVWRMENNAPREKEIKVVVLTRDATLYGIGDFHDILDANGKPKRSWWAKLKMRERTIKSSQRDEECGTWTVETDLHQSTELFPTKQSLINSL